MNPNLLPLGTGDARRLAKDYDRTKVPVPPPTAPQPDPLNGFKETSIGGVYRRGNAFSDAAGLNDNALWSRGTPSAQNQQAADALAGRGFGAVPGTPGAQREATQPPVFGTQPGSTNNQPAAPGGEMPNPGQTSPSADTTRWSACLLYTSRRG